MKTLIEQFSENGRTIEALKCHIQELIDSSWQQVWDQNENELQSHFEKGGDTAYGLYFSKLFHPIAKQLTEAGLDSNPFLPGSFPQSVERWGALEDRERRFWSVISQMNGNALGTIVTRIFHDHTRLRIPRPPQLLTLKETNTERIKELILSENLQHQVANSENQKP
ncbi:DUF6022 family protein [Bacillus capparidis]|uniref:Uncharacterized protein n=3 Tax=Bacillaceae TaxID=186817 RepID=A0A0M5JKZ2_9BACI|nr:DUF6022 family protein [Bacillus capparidis]ALC80339.1 hypothetical protein AM592_01030 [Bacillus gobiensis]MBP1083820.1 hypothetical protein [Bacillus capparidis]